MKFVFGFAIGISLAIFFAPAPGTEVRQQLRKKAIDLLQLPRKKAETLAHIGEEKAGDIGAEVGRRAAEAAVASLRDSIMGKPEGRTA
jgi:gas vesicle protein